MRRWNNMFLLSLFGFNKSIEYEFKAILITGTHTYMAYFKRPGNYFWKKITSDSLRALYSKEDIIYYFDVWTDDTEKFEQYLLNIQNNPINKFLENEKMPKIIMAIENRSEKIMDAALD